MPTPGLGNRGYIQIGKETTPGTAVAATLKFELIRENLKLVPTNIPDTSLYNARARRALYPGPQIVRGSFTIRANLEGTAELFRAVFGTYTNSLVETGVRDHIFTLTTTLASTYTLEVVKGDMPTGKCFRVAGGTLVNLTPRVAASGGAEGMMTWEFEVLGMTMTENITPTGALSFPSIFPILYHQATVIDDGTTDAQANFRMKNLEISLEQPVDDTRNYMGTVNVDQVLPNDFVVARWRITEEFNSNSLFTALRTGSTGSPRMVFQDPTTIGAASKREFEIRSGSALLMDYENGNDNYGVIKSLATWEAFQDPTDASPLYVRIRNTQAALP